MGDTKGGFTPYEFDPNQKIQVSVGAGRSWTTDRPTAAGWYWYRAHENAEPHATKVIRSDSGPSLNEFVAILHFTYKPIDAMPGEWAGPIEAPK